MDPVAMAYYGAVCGLLAAFAPSGGGRGLRFAIGLVVGLAAPALFSYLRRAVGA